MQNHQDGGRRASPDDNHEGEVRKGWRDGFGVVDPTTASLILLIGVPVLSYCILTSG